MKLKARCDKGLCLRRESTESGCEGDSGKGSPSQGRGVNSVNKSCGKLEPSYWEPYRETEWKDRDQMAKSKCHLLSSHDRNLLQK